MTDSSDHNKGAAFAPYSDQQLILQGRFNIEGAERRFVVVKQPVTAGGALQLVVYEKVGVLFANEKAAENAPDFSGTYALKTGWRFAAWRGWTERAGHFLTLRMNPPRVQERTNGSNGHVSPEANRRFDAEPPLASDPHNRDWRGDYDDDIPF